MNKNMCTIINKSINGDDNGYRPKVTHGPTVTVVIVAIGSQIS